jgi:hypothetical protein
MVLARKKLRLVVLTWPAEFLAMTVVIWENDWERRSYPLATSSGLYLGLRGNYLKSCCTLAFCFRKVIEIVEVELTDWSRFVQRTWCYSTTDEEKDSKMVTCSHHIYSSAKNFRVARGWGGLSKPHRCGSLATWLVAPCCAERHNIMRPQLLCSMLKWALKRLIWIYNLRQERRLSFLMRLFRR